ncbi:MAG: MFS transporter, partial [Actinomycetota bacterium]|nr:MFS transporter [Actinomycetota bacterium]
MLFALGNLLGPLPLGCFLDQVGRRPTTAGCYRVAGALMPRPDTCPPNTAPRHRPDGLANAPVLLRPGHRRGLTVSEVFPVEVRAMAIALFHAIGTASGEIAGPAISGQLIGRGDRGSLFLGCLVAAGLVFVSALVELALGLGA